jgi:hypothetical protein
VSVTDPHPGQNPPPRTLQAGASPRADEVVAFGRDHQVDADHDFLLAGEVYTSDLIDAYLEHRRSHVHEVRPRPHSWEFALYIDA